ncbi:MAG TPA: ABC transporter permease, partial [Rhodanobacter sp.]|nr:ABC transporter permease [Rhodanobacter sp.]
MEIALSAHAHAMPRRRVIGAYLEEARSECLRYMRAPGFMLPIMLFPAMFYLLFGVLMAKSNGADAARYLLA